MRIRELIIEYNKNILGIKTPALFINPLDVDKWKDWYVSTMHWLSEEQKKETRKTMVKSLMFKETEIDLDKTVKPSYIKILSSIGKETEIQLF